MARVTRRMFGGGFRGVVVETLLVFAFVGFTFAVSYLALRLF